MHQSMLEPMIHPEKQDLELPDPDIKSMMIRALMSGALLCSALSLRAMSGAALTFLVDERERSGAHIYHERAIFVFFKLSENWAFFESFC
jgi:hypothetical protein